MMSRDSEDLNAVTMRRFLMGLLALGFLVIVLLSLTVQVWGPVVDGETAPAEVVATDGCGHSDLPFTFLVDPRELAEGRIIIMQMRAAPGELGPGMAGQGTAWLLQLGDQLEATDACDMPIVRIIVGESHFRSDSLPPPLDTERIG